MSMNFIVLLGRNGTRSLVETNKVLFQIRLDAKSEALELNRISQREQNNLIKTR